MLNTLWPILLIISFVYGILSGRADAVNQSIFDSASSAVELSVRLLRNDMFMEWNNANCIKNEPYEKNYNYFKTNHVFFISGNREN